MAKKQRRAFTPEYKTRIVLELLSGAYGPKDLCRREKLREQTLNQWKKKFLQGASKAFSEQATQKEEEQKVAELERMVGQLTMENAILKKVSSILNPHSSKNGS